MLLAGNRMIEVSCSPTERASVLDSVYIGRVSRMIDRLEAVFVEIAPGRMAYLPMQECEAAWMAKQQRPGRLTEGDEIVVQVVREAVKTKEPVVTTNISVKGNALILTSKNKKLGVSNKLDAEKRKHYQSLFADKKEESFGLVVRTNAENITDERLLEEFEILCGQFHKLEAIYRFRTCYSCLYHAPDPYILSVRDYLAMELEKIVTDDKEIYEHLCDMFGKEARVADKLEFYEDPLVSLSVLYGLKSKLDDALSRKVWLKSGAYLVIEPTEAMTVIDVNSGKCIKGKQEDFYFNVNLEAAEEIARQLRLRNISGICIVDFINMDTEEAKTKLVRALKQCLKNDTVPASFVDFTKLGLAEITRKKIKKPLWEQISWPNA